MLDTLYSVKHNIYTVSQKNCANLFFCQNFVKFRPIVKIFGTKVANRTSFLRYRPTHFPPHLIYVNALPC